MWTLGLDISTKCVGWCTLTETGEFVKVGHLDLSAEKGLYKKLDLFRSFFKRFDPDGYRVIVEAPLQRSNNQNVVNLLQRWNGMCCGVLYQWFDLREPTLIEQRTALKELGIKVPKGVKGPDRKKYILQCVQGCDKIPESSWEVNRNGNPHAWCFDQADAYVIAKAGLKLGE